MANNKLTDEQIIKALECCQKDDCDNCPLSNYDGCKSLLFDGDIVLDLINRLKAQNKEFDEKIVMQMGLIEYQKAEIERLKDELAQTEDAFNKIYEINGTYERKIDTAKSEAIKEFAERLSNLTASYWLDNINKGHINDLVKEMVGAAEESSVGEKPGEGGSK